MAGANISIPAQGTTFEIEDTEVSPTFHMIGGRKTFNFAEAEAAENDETVLTSDAKEYSLGLPDSGTYSETLQYNRSDAGQQELHAAKIASEERNFRLTLADGSVGTFAGLVKSFPFTGAVGGSLEGSYSVRITGAVTWS
jgi:hypothetical protein